MLDYFAKLVKARLAEILAVVERSVIRGKDFVEWPRLVCLKTQKQYILSVWVQSSKACTSWISAHGTNLTLVTSDTNIKTRAWCCGICYQIFNAHATNGATTHLKAKHNIRKSQQSDGEDDSEPIGRSVLDQLRDAAEKKIGGKLTTEDFKRLLVCWIVRNNVPFRAVEDPYFKDLFAFFDQDGGLIKAVWPEHGVTIKN